jgi:hypothetical protein
MDEKARTWHEKHRMPAKATMEQRIAWHEEHAQVCGCREVPLSVQAEIEKRCSRGAGGK